MSICFLLPVLVLVTPSWKCRYLTDCLLWSLTVISQRHIVAWIALPVPKDDCSDIVIYGYFNVLWSWWWNSVTAQSGNTSSCCVVTSQWFWKLFPIVCHRLCATFGNIIMAPRAHQLLMWKPTCLIIHQYGFLVSSCNYGRVWCFWTSGEIYHGNDVGLWVKEGQNKKQAGIEIVQSHRSLRAELKDIIKESLNLTPAPQFVNKSENNWLWLIEISWWDRHGLEITLSAEMY